MDDLGAVGEVFSAALYGAQMYENEHHNTLESISRLTQLYDIEKVFSSTLEMDQLFPNHRLQSARDAGVRGGQSMAAGGG